MLRNAAYVFIGSLIGSVIVHGVHAVAQAPQAPPPCEAQLDQLQDAMLRLKKAKAEVDWQAATFEEMAKALKKQVDAAKPKAEEKKP